MFYENYPLLSTDYLEQKHGDDLSFPAHLHQCFEFITITKGELQVTVDEKTYLLRPGEGLLIFPHQIHSFFTPRHSRHLLWVFSPQLVQAYAAKTNALIPESNWFRPDPVLLRRLSQPDMADSLFARKGALYSLCADFHRTASYQERVTGPDDLLCRIFGFVEEHYAGECTLTDLAKETAYDYAYLSRYFKRCVGMSYTEYINRFRIHTACYLLKNQNRPVIKIAYEVGFRSLRSFNRNFQAILHMTPGEYRLQS